MPCRFTELFLPRTFSSDSLSEPDSVKGSLNYTRSATTPFHAWGRGTVNREIVERAWLRDLFKFHTNWSTRGNCLIINRYRLGRFSRILNAFQSYSEMHSVYD